MTGQLMAGAWPTGGGLPAACSMQQSTEFSRTLVDVWLGLPVVCFVCCPSFFFFQLFNVYECLQTVYFAIFLPWEFGPG